ncbi:MAG: hypothetical protein AABY53_00245 [Bdellovibrionota bacterium]
MTQIMTGNKVKNGMNLVLITLLSMTILSSCAKKDDRIRATVKTQQTNLNPTVSAQADQQGASVSADYKIATVAIPTQTGSGFTVSVELQSPSGEILPLTTRHENGVLDSEGVYSDSQRGLQIYVQARCSQDSCTKYTLIVTTFRNNQALYQAAAISYKDDCKFNSVSASYSAGSFIQSLNDAENKYNTQPQGDCPIEI